MRLRELRKERKLLQRTVAEAINCSQAVYSRYENGEREPSNDVLATLADFYGVTIDYLLGRDDPPPPPRGPETQRVIDAILAKLAQLDEEGLKNEEAHIDFMLSRKKGETT